MNKVALLTRVSTVDQSNERHITELKAFAADRNYNIIEIVTEIISGAKKNEGRKGLQRVLELASKKKINKILVHEVTRLGRDTSQVLTTLENLHKAKVSVVVMNYQLETLNPDGSLNSMAQFLFTLLVDIGRMERMTLISRVKSGMQQAAKNGIHCGRPKGTTKDKEKILSEYKKVAKYLNDGYTIRETAKLCEIGTSTVMRVKKLLN